MKNLATSVIAAFAILASVLPSAPVFAETSATGSASAAVSAAVPAKDWKFSRNLSVGTKHAEVTELQKFLTEQGFYAGPVTGNYFQLTMQAVQKFQKANGVEATGFFGVKSRGVANGIREKLANFICSNDQGCVIPAPVLTITAESDLSAAVGANFNAVFRVGGGNQPYEIKGMGEVPGLTWTRNECPPGVYCIKGADPDSISLTGVPKKPGIYTVTVMAREEVSSPCKDLPSGTPCPMLYPNPRYGKASFTIVIKGDGQSTTGPVLKGVKGPAELKVSEEGTWTIQASGKGSLAYSVTWGDEMPAASANSPKAGASMQFIQTATFSHRYSNPGLYTAVFKVADENGNVATASLGVKVGEVLVNAGGSITIEPDQTILRPGREAKLAAYYQPPVPPCPKGMFCAQMMPPRIAVRANWRTSDPDVALLREPNCVDIGTTSGISNCQNMVYVLGGKPGTATVTAMYEAGGQQFSAKALITVAPSELSGTLTISPASAALKVGSSTLFTALYQDPLPPCAYATSGAVCKIAVRPPYPVTVDWYLDNPSVASLAVAVGDCAPISGANLTCTSFTAAQLTGTARGAATLTATYIRGDGSPKVDAKAAITVN